MLTVIDKPQEIVHEVNRLEKIDWDTVPDSDPIKKAIDFALANGYASMAINLAAKGHQLFPEDADLQKIARVLAPPRVIRTDVPPVAGLEGMLEWLKENSRHYRGQWVAVKEGKLVGHAQTREALSERIGDGEKQTDVIITKIPGFQIDF